MYNRQNRKRDPFRFSLGGLRAVASFSLAPAIADDLINRRREREARGRRLWQPCDTRAALDGR